MKLGKARLTLEQALLARITDELTFQSWSKTKDGQRNRNRPESILKVLTTEKKEDNEVFMTPEDFDKAWEKITHGKR